MASASTKKYPFERTDGTTSEVEITENFVNQGATSHVYKGFMIHNGQCIEVAVKFYYFRADEGSWAHPEDNPLVDAFFAECATLKRLPPHDNVVHCYGFGRNFVVEELMQMDLGELVHNSQGRSSLKFYQLLVIFKQVAAGLNYLFQHNVIHYDLKPANVLLNISEAGYVTKVADFGVSQWRATTYLTGELKGTLAYMAPELIEAALMNTKVNVKKLDVFSFGVLMREFVAGVAPQTDQEVDADRGIPEEMLRFINRCSNKLKDERPAWEEVMHWFDEVQVSNYEWLTWPIPMN